MPQACAVLIDLFLFLDVSAGDVRPLSMRVETQEWQIAGLSTQEISRSGSFCEIRISADGSRQNRCQGQRHELFVWPGSMGKFESLYRAKEGVAYRFDFPQAGNADAIECQGSGVVRPKASGGSPCQEFVADGRRFDKAHYEGIGVLLGQKVARYRIEEEYRTTYMSLAPELGCMLLEARALTRGLLGLPVSEHTTRVTRLERREPEASHFVLPSEYRLKFRRRF